MAIVTTILGISLLIILHELGHYLVARWCGMRPLTFSIGFGPTLLKRQVGETSWQIAAVPLGGYVHIDGMGPKDTDVFPDDERSFRNKPSWQRAAVVFAGPLMNWLLAAFFIMSLAATVGFAKADESRAVLGELVEGGAAEKAGLAKGDLVVSIAGKPLADWASFVAEVREHPNEPVPFELERAGARMTITVTPEASASGGIGVIGVYPPTVTQRLGPVSAVIAGITGAWDMSAKQFALLWGMVRGTQKGELAGLPGIVKMVAAEAKRGLERLFSSLAWLSITLCVLNLLPVPALDGSRLVFIGLETVRGKPFPEKAEATIHGVGFALLLGLMIFVSVRDLL